jgi:hypothetical protein
MPRTLPFDKSALKQYLTGVYKTDVQVTEIRELVSDKREDRIKDFGYGNPLLVELIVAGKIDHIVLHTVRPDKFGHERRADRASNILLDYDSFNKLPRHVPCLGIGAFTNDGSLLSLENSNEFFLITKYMPGRLFAQDLKKLLDEDVELIPEDKARVLALSDYLVQIHSHKKNNPDGYRRSIRDLFGHGEGIFGLTDSYPPNFEVAPPARLLAIERRLIDWRWGLKERTHRLSQVHGDYHPWNVLFQKNGNFHVLDRSRGEWGEPADDVSAMSINFIFFSLQRYGALRGAFKVLFDVFWEHYLQNTRDVEISNIIQPFYAWRALVLAHPTWYPHISYETRQHLFTFIENVLAEEWFDPRKINSYLRVKT